MNLHLGGQGGQGVEGEWRTTRYIDLRERTNPPSGVSWLKAKSAKKYIVFRQAISGSCSSAIS